MPNIEKLFQGMESCFKVSRAARVVSSFEEAKSIRAFEEHYLNKRYNRFGIAAYFTSSRCAIINFSFYIDFLNDQVYGFLEELDNPAMLVKYKKVPYLEFSLSLSRFSNDMFLFMDTQLQEAIEDYFEGTKFGTGIVTGLDPSNGLYSIFTGGSASGFLELGRTAFYRKAKLVYYPSNMPGKWVGTDDYADVVSNFADIVLARSMSGNYYYAYSNGYLWSIKSKYFLYYLDSAHKLCSGDQDSSCFRLLES